MTHTVAAFHALEDYRVFRPYTLNIMGVAWIKTASSRHYKSEDNMFEFYQLPLRGSLHFSRPVLHCCICLGHHCADMVENLATDEACEVDRPEGEQGNWTSGDCP